MRRFNGKVADDSIYIEDHQVQTGLRSDLEPGLFSHICRITQEYIFSWYKETCEGFLDYPKIEGDNTK